MPRILFVVLQAMTFKGTVEYLGTSALGIQDPLLGGSVMDIPGGYSGLQLLGTTALHHGHMATCT